MAYGQTFWTIKKAIARACGPDVFVAEGTLTGGGATTAIDTVNWIDATDSTFKGVHFYVGNGTAQSRETRATAFTAGTDTLTLPSGTAVDNTSEYLLTRIPQKTILLAMRRVLWRRGPYGKSFDDQSLIAGSPLRNATFYDGSGTFPNNWTTAGTGGTFTQESTIPIPHGRYALKMVSNGTNACSVFQDIPYAGSRGVSAYLKCWAFCNTADRAYILIDDAIDTTTGIFTLPTTNDGWGSAARQSASLPVSNRATRVRITLGITSGSAVTAYFAAPYPVGLPYNYEWPMPAGSPSHIGEILAESFEGGPFGCMLDNEAFTVVEESTERLRLKTSGVPLGRILHLKGRTNWADHTDASTDDDDTFEGDASGLIDATAALLMSKSPEEQRRVLETHWFSKATQAPVWGWTKRQ